MTRDEINHSRFQQDSAAASGAHKGGLEVATLLFDVVFTLFLWVR